MTFVDVTVPTVTCPSDIVVNITEESVTNATVPFVVSCRDEIDGNIQPICNAIVNVTQFSVGETSVTCSCEDDSHNTEHCSFKVTVKGLFFGFQIKLVTDT